MSEHVGDAAAIIENAILSATPIPVGENSVAVALPEGARLHVVDIEEANRKHAERPLRKKGTYRVHDADSFARYMGKHSHIDSEVWADVHGNRIVGVINAHGEADLAGWGDHRVEYAVKHTPAWQAWAQYDGKLLGQSEFAELIEDRAIDIVRPAAADMLEVAQTFQATIGVSFESSKLLSSGERQLTYKEDVNASAGRRGTLEIPKDFDLGLIPFEGAEAFKITARFRYRITDGVLRVGYKLNRPEDVLREAFESVVRQVEAEVVVPVFRGTD